MHCIVLLENMHEVGDVARMGNADGVPAIHVVSAGLPKILAFCAG
jgi:hypothetical protein